MNKEQIAALPQTEDGTKYNPATHLIMTLNRRHSLGSTLGHRILFEKNKQTPVPKVLLEEALAIGAERVDGQAAFAEPVAGAQPLSPEARATAIRKALDEVVAKNDRDDFTAAGNPSLKALEKITNFRVDKLEQQRAVKERNESLAAS
jgi:hypothetical protein